MRFYARIFGDKGTTSTKTSSPLTGDPAKPCDSLPRQSQQCPCWIPGAKTPWNKLGKNLVNLPAGMCGHLLFPCCSHTDLVQHRQNTRCGIHKDSVSWMPCSADTPDAVKSQSCRLHSQRAMKQGFFIAAPGTRGISPPNVHPKHPIVSG